MSLRIAWSFYPRHTSLAIAANIFVYAGTIILYGLDWFFVQRIIRAQHTHFGWSTGYRVFHRTGLVLLIFFLMMLIVSQIWQFFTLDPDKLSAFHDLFMAAQTYFTVFTVAPAFMVMLSLLVPRVEVEKFGAGRMRNNITILLLAVFILSIGQGFRCILTFIPPTPLQSIQRGRQPVPFYLSKAFFYCFNFVTEILVITMFAIVRIDLRFHIPNGARKTGDYSNSHFYLGKNDTERDLPTHPPLLHRSASCSTLHRYESSIFEDTSTLADSLRYPSSIIEMDEKTGTWKVKRLSRDSSSRNSSSFFSRMSHYKIDKNLYSQPPGSDVTSNWPLSDSMPGHGSEPVLEHSNRGSRRYTSKRGTYEFDGHYMNTMDVGDAVTDALKKLEMNSELNKWKTLPQPPRARTSRSVHVQKSAPALKSRARAMTSASLSAPRSQSQGRAESRHAHTASEPAVPRSTEFEGVPHAITADQRRTDNLRAYERRVEEMRKDNMRSTSPSYTERLETIDTHQRMSRDSPRSQEDEYYNRKRASSVPSCQSPLFDPNPSIVTESDASYPLHHRYKVSEDFRRSSYEAPPRPYDRRSPLNSSRCDLPYAFDRDELWMGR